MWYTQVFPRQIFSQKGFSLWKRREADICWGISSQFHSILWTFVLIFYFKHVFRKGDRKVLMESVFSMDRGFKVKLCLWGPPLPINANLIYKFRYGSNPNHLIHFGKSCVNHSTTRIVGGDAYNFWQEYRAGKNLKLSDYLNQF